MPSAEAEPVFAATIADPDARLEASGIAFADVEFAPTPAAAYADAVDDAVPDAGEDAPADAVI